jgi:hypothetical protein
MIDYIFSTPLAALQWKAIVPVIQGDLLLSGKWGKWRKFFDYTSCHLYTFHHHHIQAVVVVSKVGSLSLVRIDGTCLNLSCTFI